MITRIPGTAPTASAPSSARSTCSTRSPKRPKDERSRSSPRRRSLPKSSIFRYLATLEARGYVERDGERGRFRVGRRLVTLHSRRLELLARAARPRLDALRDRFQETVNLGVLDGDRVSYLQIVESPQAMRFAAREGDRDPIHSTSLGKAIASQLSREHVRGSWRARACRR